MVDVATLRPMTLVHLVVGSTGAGKSTYSKAFAAQHRVMRFAIDEWMVALFGKDRPEDAGYAWYSDRIERCTNQIWSECLQLLALGHGVVLEIGLTNRAARSEFYQRVEAAGYDCQLHVLEAPRELRWQRVEQRNRERGDTYSLEVTRDMFDFVETMWEPPDEAECTERNVGRNL